MPENNPYAYLAPGVQPAQPAAVPAPPGVQPAGMSIYQGAPQGSFPQPVTPVPQPAPVAFQPPTIEQPPAAPPMQPAPVPALPTPPAVAQPQPQIPVQPQPQPQMPMQPTPMIPPPQTFPVQPQPVPGAPQLGPADQAFMQAQGVPFTGVFPGQGEPVGLPSFEGAPGAIPPAPARVETREPARPPEPRPELPRVRRGETDAHVEPPAEPQIPASDIVRGPISPTERLELERRARERRERS